MAEVQTFSRVNEQQDPQLLIRQLQQAPAHGDGLNTPAEKQWRSREPQETPNKKHWNTYTQQELMQFFFPLNSRVHFCFRRWSGVPGEKSHVWSFDAFVNQFLSAFWSIFLK